MIFTCVFKKPFFPAGKALNDVLFINTMFLGKFLTNFI